MRLLISLLFLFILVGTACDNPTAGVSNSVIDDGTGGGTTPVAPTISGSLSITSNDSTKTLARIIDWSAITYSSGSSLANTKFEIAIGFDSGSNGFDSGDHNNLLDWTEPPTSLTSTSHQFTDGVNSVSLNLKSGVDYYFSIRATDSTSQVSNVLSSAAWQTLAVPLWFTNNANWLDASDTSTLFQNSACTTPATANADPIGCWQDKSGNTNHALDSITEAAPVNIAAGLNSLNIIDFNGAEGLLIASDPTLNSSVGFTLFLVMLQDGNAANQTIYRGRLNGGYGTQPGISFEITNSQYNNTIYEDTAGNAEGTSSLGAIPTTAIVHRIDMLNNGNLELIQNGTNTGLAANNGAGGLATGAVTNSNIGLGFNDSDDARNLRGQIAEIILYTKELTTTENEIVEGYLACKWGLQASLPGVHSYSATCP